MPSRPCASLEAEAALKRFFGEVIQEKKDSKMTKRKHPFQKTLKLLF
jgi:hypothetical protein